MGNQLLAMLNVFENFDSELSLLIEEFKEIRDIFALHKDTWLPSARGGDLSAFGAKGTNNHIEMYYEKKVFDSYIDFMN